MSTEEAERKAICIMSFGMALTQACTQSATHLFHRVDNGGPGTYSQLLILKEYMSRLANDLNVAEEELYPADYFDLMGGVGFGG
jgi:hypothetical protein